MNIYLLFEVFDFTGWLMRKRKELLRKLLDKYEEEEKECADNEDDGDCRSCPTHVSDSITA